ncbi:MAG: TlpA family protein disulfide reductase [Sphingobacteriia bacterium]|nr:MAG: TlpA family protein disulfide reductase [Sphingobacteriia bacterium]
MKKCLFGVFLLLTINLIAQNPPPKKITINENTVVKTSDGTVLSYSIWQSMLMSGDFNLKAEDPSQENTSFILYPISQTEKEKRFASLPKPKESPYFQNGKPFGKFKTTDMYGNSINLKDYEGKTLVINFWFINCPPCRSEIPHLNKLVDKYKEDKNIAFIAIALDDASDIETFIKTYPYKYQIIDKGRWIASKYGINSYPTNVVVDKAGLVQFHSNGYSIQLPYWIEKTIESIK